MRPEQQRAVKKTQEYFAQFKKDNPGKAPRFLWNAKMRFGKTFTSYEFAKAQGYQRVLVLTFKPAVENSWREDLESHKDFEGWQFISRETTQNGGLDYEHADKSRPIVCFGSFQDYLGKNEAGDIKAQNEWVHEINWDLVIFDEYYFGAWRDSARELFEQEDKCEQNDNMNSVAQLIDESFEQGDTDFLPITTGAYLFCQARRSARSSTASSSKNRSSTGRIPTSSGPRRGGSRPRGRIRTNRCHAWC